MYTGVFQNFIVRDFSNGGSGRSRISPRWGANPPGGPTYDFAKFSPKLVDIERIWAPDLPLGAPTLKKLYENGKNLEPEKDIEIQNLKFV